MKCSLLCPLAPSVSCFTYREKKSKKVCPPMQAVIPECIPLCCSVAGDRDGTQATRVHPMPPLSLVLSETGAKTSHQMGIGLKGPGSRCCSAVRHRTDSLGGTGRVQQLRTPLVFKHRDSRVPHKNLNVSAQQPCLGRQGYVLQGPIVQTLLLFHEGGQAKSLSVTEAAGTL